MEKKTIGFKDKLSAKKFVLLIMVSVVMIATGAFL